MDEDDFYRDFYAFLQINVMDSETIEDALLSVEYHVPDDLQEMARDYVLENFPVE